MEELRALVARLSAEKSEREGDVYEAAAHRARAEHVYQDTGMTKMQHDAAKANLEDNIKVELQTLMEHAKASNDLAEAEMDLAKALGRAASAERGGATNMEDMSRAEKALQRAHAAEEKATADRESALAAGTKAEAAMRRADADAANAAAAKAQANADLEAHRVEVASKATAARAAASNDGGAATSFAPAGAPMGQHVEAGSDSDLHAKVIQTEEEVRALHDEMEDANLTPEQEQRLREAKASATEAREHVEQHGDGTHQDAPQLAGASPSPAAPR